MDKQFILAIAVHGDDDGFHTHVCCPMTSTLLRTIWTFSQHPPTPPWLRLALPPGAALAGPGLPE
ncbi:hypothetical protein E2C01_053679 [Portunus trituberculatus]|uniref:Uncharacterized protein n=1 Tax=Portunus trituberculatus TaxID=210409 RepID=A0A5B7GQR9_PORTR|nr:hypothetical protein [Portunus trituberculatus]